jgi:2-amino-4-hydroxy-6-hydroxymethyldihydropteridine diphosphokinase
VQFARARLVALLDNLEMSSIYETAPVGVPEGQPRFLNAAATGRTRLQAPDLLAALLAIEEECGRERPFHLAPRTLDLDLILFGEEIIDRPGLIVPHPRFRERAFVLEPLAEIAPDLRDPVTGKTVRELRDAAI